MNRYLLNLRVFFRRIQFMQCLPLLLLLLPLQLTWARSDAIICKQCNLLLLNIDFLRADYVGSRTVRSLTPSIDHFFEKGLIFNNAYSPSGSTYRGNLAVFTATNPFFYMLDVETFESLQSKASFNYWKKIYSSQTTLAEYLHSAGYRTVMLNKGMRSGRRTMLDRGFSAYKQFPIQTLLEDQIDYLLETLQKITEPFFIHFHAIPTRLHRAFYPVQRHRAENKNIIYFPYSLHGEPYGYKVIRNRSGTISEQRHAEHTIYKQQLIYADEQIKRIFDRISDLLDRTVVILVSTHGTQLGDKEIFASNGVSYESNIRVPLMIKVPGRTFDGTINNRVTLLDFTPTVLHLLDLSDDIVDGYNLLAIIDDGEEYHRPFIAGLNDKDAYVIKDKWKLFVKYEIKRSLHKLRDGKLDGDDLFKNNKMTSLILESSVNQGFDLNIRLQTNHFVFKKTTLESPQLYDLSVDPFEKNDLANERPEITNDLLRLLHRYRLKAKSKIDQLNGLAKPSLPE